MTSLELCPKCHAHITSEYEPSFEKDLARAFQHPTPPDVSCIKSILENASTAMANMAQEIKRAESMLIALKARHAHLNTFIQENIHYIRPSPIGQLPTEVLGIIFASACTSFHPSEYKTPLSISLVCSKWRDIALSAPSLWTHIYIAPHSGGLDVYNHFLKRCGNVPVSVKVEIPSKGRPPASDEDVSYEETREYHLELISAIGHTCAQWKIVDLCMNHNDINLLGSHIQRLESPLLESLTLENDGPLSLLQSDLFKQTVTSLTVLDKKGVMSLRFYETALPWRQLREICIQSDVDSLRHHNDDFEDGKNRTLVLRPHLYQIKLPRGEAFSLRVSTLVLDSAIWTDSLMEFFQLVTIPTLESLTMLPPDPYPTSRYFVPGQWTNPFSALSEFLARSECALQTFTVIMRGRFEGCTFLFTRPTLADGLLHALHGMTKLKALHIIEAESGPSLFQEQLFWKMAEGHLLPKLATLEMVWAEGRQPVDALIPMLDSRCGQGAAGMKTLSSVVLGVRNGGDLRDDVLECMASLRQQGIQATLW